VKWAFSVFQGDSFISQSLRGRGDARQKFLVRGKNFLVRTKNFLVRTKNFLVRTKNLLVRTKNFLVRTKNLLVRTKNLLVRTKNFLVRGKKLLPRGKKFIPRGKKSYPPAFDAPDTGFECLPRVSGQPSKGYKLSINKKSCASIRCAARAYAL
jgi:hypothetical protein